MTTKSILSALFILVAALLCGCEAFDNLYEDAHAKIFGGEDDDANNSGKREYRYIDSMTTLTYAAVIDPYDGSLDLVDPVRRDRVKISTKPDPIDAAILVDGITAAVLDGGTKEVRFVNTESYAVTSVASVGEAINRLVPSIAGSYVLGIYDPNRGSANFGDSGLINYFELDILDARGNPTRTVSIDFTPDNILFLPPDGNSCLISKGYRVLRLNLDDGSTTAFPLTLNPQESRTPETMIISSDGALAVITVLETTDVYVLDLELDGINILDTALAVSDAAFVPGTHTALLALPDNAALAVVDLDIGIPETIDLGDSYQSILMAPDGLKAVLFSDGGSSLAVTDLTEWKTKIHPLNGMIDMSTLDNPIQISSNSRYIAVTELSALDSYSSSALDILDLETRVAVPFGLESWMEDFQFSPTGFTAGILLPYADKLVVLNLATMQAFSRPVEADSIGLGYVPAAGSYVVDYDREKGRLAFVNEMDPENFWLAETLFDAPK